MDLTLTRQSYNSWGIISTLADADGAILFYTLEHAYVQPDGSYAPKVPSGTYTCLQGMHNLPGLSGEFQTYEVQAVPGHTGILFHPGNYNKDSEGCILVGTDVSPESQMITQSGHAFAKFLTLQQNDRTFQLTVV